MVAFSRSREMAGTTLRWDALGGTREARLTDSDVLSQHRVATTLSWCVIKLFDFNIVSNLPSRLYGI